MQKLPPLNALKAFEAAARHSNFTKAAEELRVTQGAISKQVKILEEFLGSALFDRKNSQLVLNAAGSAYLHAITQAFSTIQHATAHFMEEHKHTDTLRILAVPSLNSKWLVPLLGDFHKRYPDIQVKVEIAHNGMDIANAETDMAICVARKNIWKNMHVEKLMGEEMLPVCSPQLKSDYALNHPTDLVRVKLLQHTTRPNMWQEYLEAIGHGSLESKHHLGFAHFYMLAPAAEDGLGVALIPRYLIKKELARGSLVVAFQAEFKSPYYCYLVCPKPTHDLRKVMLFRRWIKECAKNEV